MRLLLALHWLRQNFSLSLAYDLYHISKATAFRELKTVIPIVYRKLVGIIHWPNEFWSGTIFNVVGAIDCTPHFRNRPHPGSLYYYRGNLYITFLSYFVGDYKDYCYTVQAVVGLNGQLWSVHIGTGHNNDQGMFNLTNMEEFLRKNNIRLLADRGYWCDNWLITPRDTIDSAEQNLVHKKFRSIVERIFGLVKIWRVASEHFKSSPEFQVMCLSIIYSLVRMHTDQFPLVR